MAATDGEAVRVHEAVTGGEAVTVGQAVTVGEAVTVRVGEVTRGIKVMGFPKS